MQDNRVFINDKDIIEIMVIGNQTVASIQIMGEQAISLAKRQREAGKPALLLDNLLQMGTVPAEGRKRVMELVRSSDYDRLAMFGKDTVLRLGANLILQATGRGDTVRYFEDRSLCEAWLLQAVEDSSS
ncbi:MAG TPA: hypothetical protein VLF59_01155 [Candidatus Saccharimonadales bacterium]|nr:hypothetical protein [Candidatus Saccharimonadales bacterium]